MKTRSLQGLSILAPLDTDLHYIIQRNNINGNHNNLHIVMSASGHLTDPYSLRETEMKIRPRHRLNILAS